MGLSDSRPKPINVLCILHSRWVRPTLPGLSGFESFFHCALSRSTPEDLVCSCLTYASIPVLGFRIFGTLAILNWRNEASDTSLLSLRLAVLLNRASCIEIACLYRYAFNRQLTRWVPFTPLETPNLT